MFMFIYIFCFSVISSTAKTILLDCVKGEFDWGVLDMYVLLNEDIFEFDVNVDRSFAFRIINDKLPKFPYKDHGDLLLQLLEAKCPISNCLKWKMLNPIKCLFVYKADAVILDLTMCIYRLCIAKICNIFLYFLDMDQVLHIAYKKK